MGKLILYSVDKSIPRDFGCLGMETALQVAETPDYGYPRCAYSCHSLSVRSASNAFSADCPAATGASLPHADCELRHARNA